MATATSSQVAAPGQHELASRVSNHFIAARLASARQEENELKVVGPMSSQEIKVERNRAVAAGQPPARHADNQQRASNQSANEMQRNELQTKLATNWPHQRRSPVKHETDSASSSASESDGQFEAGEQNNEQPNKPHVGPMGIFFKVWSLVKVTKSRHSRMKRQLAETNAGQQFRFVAGDQLGGGSSTLAGGSSPEFGAKSVPAPARGHHQQRQPVQRIVLQDSHFKRAGSQPPPLSHLERRLLNTAGHLHTGHTTNGLRTLNSNTATGTTSSSSGVSSTTSSTLATSYSDALQIKAADSTRRRHNNETSPPVSVERQNQGRSWSARMRPNSVSNQRQEPTQVAADSRALRHGNRRDGSDDKRQSMQLAAANGPPGDEAKRPMRAQSELRQLEELRRKAVALTKSTSPAALIGGTKSKMSLRHFRLRPRHDSVSDDDEDDDDDDGAEAYDEDDEDDDDEQDDGERRDRVAAAAARTRQSGCLEPDDEADSDLNDIYSTPNDSIQSVPSGQMMLGNDSNSKQPRAQQPLRRAPAPEQSCELRTPTTPSNGSSSRMTKSFSANYFSQLTSDAQAARWRRGASDEPKLVAAAAGPRTSATILEQDKTIDRKQAESRPTQAAAQSRFFISSSSSEDSNPAPPAEAQSPQADSHQWSVPLKQHQIPVQSAVHYHGPPVARPATLAVALESNNSANPVHLVVESPSVLTPSTLLIEPRCLAMSPVLADSLQSGRTAAAPSCRRLVTRVIGSSHYTKSPSLFDMKSNCQPPSQAPRFSPSAHLVQRYSSKYPQREPMSSFVPKMRLANDSPAEHSPRQSMGKFSVPNSVSLHDCKLTSVKFGHLNGARVSSPVQAVGKEVESDNDEEQLQQVQEKQRVRSEYKLAQMLLELGSNGGAKDESGQTALMHAIISENLSAFKCLIEHGVDLNDVNNEDASALDLICNRPANETLLEMLKLMIDNRADLDRVKSADGSRLLDRLIGEHETPNRDKSHYIDCLLHNGAKLGSSTWLAARGKHEIQLKLLRKLCQDGYHLYKKCSIEAAVFRFEYALKRIDELEQQLLANSNACHQSKCHSSKCHSLRQLDPSEQQAAMRTTQLVKYQTFLGLSRCERKRGFFKRALEFANMSILIDSTSYEGYYSKAHILKDIGERAEAILTIDQTGRLVSKSIELIRSQLDELHTQEESLVFDGCFNVHEPNKLNWIESTRLELESNLNYLTEAKRHVTRLRSEIVNDEQS